MDNLLTLGVFECSTRASCWNEHLFLEFLPDGKFAITRKAHEYLAMEADVDYGDASGVVWPEGYDPDEENTDQCSQWPISIGGKEVFAFEDGCYLGRDLVPIDDNATVTFQPGEIEQARAWLRDDYGDAATTAFDEKFNELEKTASTIYYEDGNAELGGLAIAHSAVDSGDLAASTDWWDWEDRFDEQRIVELEGGAAPTDEELEALTQMFLEHEFENQGDHTTAIWFCWVPDNTEGPRLLVLLVGGHHTTGLSQRFFGAFENEAFAYKALEKQFYLQGV